MREGVIHPWPTVFPILEKAQAKNSRSYFQQKYCEITNTIPPSSFNRASGFTLLKAHKAHYVQSHTFKALIQDASCIHHNIHHR